MGSAKITQELKALERGASVGKLLSYVFFAALIVVLVVSLYEYYTVQEPWLDVATLLFTVLVVIPFVLLIQLRLHVERKQRTVESLRREMELLEEDARRKKSTG